MHSDFNCALTLGKGKVRSSKLRGGTTFPLIDNDNPQAGSIATPGEMEERGTNKNPALGETLGNASFGAPDGSGAPARLKLYRGRWYLVWTAEGRTRRVALGADTLETAVARATARYGRLGRDDPGKARSIQHWLTKRLQGARERAKQAGVPCTLTADDMRRLYERSNGCCEISGIPFDLSAGKNGWKQPWRMSLDRIVPELGYTPENCRLVCNAVNAAMGAWGADVLVRIAHAIVEKTR